MVAVKGELAPVSAQPAVIAATTAAGDTPMASGAGIPIEERAPEEVLHCGGKRIGPEGVGAWNPVFDVTPAGLVDAIVTERGVILSPNAEKLAAHMQA